MRLRALPPLGLLAAAVVVSRPARAEVHVQTRLGTRQVEIGDATQFQITVLATEGEVPSSPRLSPVPGLEIQGPQTEDWPDVMIFNGQLQQRHSFSFTWLLRGKKAGTFRVGPASVEVKGERVQGQAGAVEVVPEGQLQRRSLDPFGFMDPLGGGFPFPPGMPNPFGPNGLGQEPEPEPAVPEEYRMERAPDPVAFVRTTITPQHPVVGEQITLRLYVYARPSYGLSDLAEFTYPDFLDYSAQGLGDTHEGYRVPIGENVFVARRVRELALFPLHAGRLAISAATATLTNGGRGPNPTLTRSSGALTVNVTEPPLERRPPGYRIGDVGKLTLEAVVDPRKITAGDSVGVIAKLEGTGSIPTVLRVPEQRGVEWQDPTHTDQIVRDKGPVHGSRVFNYVVKLSEAGTVSLGELKLPYWDPERRTYDTARAKLGRIEVAPSAKPAPAASAATAATAADPLALKPRRAFSTYGTTATPFTDGSRFWFLVFGAPLAVGLTGVGLELGGRLRRRLDRTRSSPERLAYEALKQAESAARGSEIAKTAAAIERALFLGIEAGTGVRARALLRGDLKAALAEAGFSAGTIERTLELLDACESARFTGKAGALPPLELRDRARGVLSELVRKRKKS